MLKDQEKGPSCGKQDDLSSAFFDKVPELAIIDQPFALADIDKQISTRDIDSQFELLRAITETKKHKVGFRSNSVLENRKNRYPEQSIFQKSRVHVISNRPGDEAVEGKKRSKGDYINANYITWPDQSPNDVTIMTQAPLQNTLNDFVATIVQNKIECVVMLCNVTENGKNRCYDYLNQKNLFDVIQQVPLDSIVHKKYGSQSQVEIRKIRVRKGQSNQQETAQQYHEFHHVLYTGWPDKSVPESASCIQPIIDVCSKYSRVLVHCSAGLGRSGVVVALRQIVRDLILKPTEGISVFRVSRIMRECRFGAVQNSQQYKFIYQYMKFYQQVMKLGQNGQQNGEMVNDV